MEKSLNLLSDTGYFSYIVPNSWLTIDSGIKLRKEILNNFSIVYINDINYEVFDTAKVEPSVFVITQKGTYPTKCRKLSSAVDFEKDYYVYDQQQWIKNSDNCKITIVNDLHLDEIAQKIEKQSSRIGDLFDTRAGLQAYEKGKGKPKQTAEDVKEHIFDYNYKFDKNTIAYLDGKNCGRYSYSFNSKYLRYGEWLSQTRTIDIFNRKRVLIREITGKFPNSIIANYFEETFLNNKSIINVLDYNDNEENLKLLLGQLNSKLLSVYYKARAVKSSRKLFPKIVIKDLQRFPCLIDMPNDYKVKIISCVNNLLLFNKIISETINPQEKIQIGKDIKITEKLLNRLIYSLYNLTEQDIKYIEKLESI